MTNNYGASYYALNRGGRSSYLGSDATVLNPSNIVINNSSFSVNSFCYDKYCSFGSSYAVNSDLALFVSVDEFDKDISFDSFSTFASFALKISDRFSIGASLGYFYSSLFKSGFKYTSSISFSPYNLDKQFNKWLISAGYLSNFLTNNMDEYFLSYTYTDKVFSISFDYLFSEENNYEVVAGTFNLTDSLKLISSIKFLDFKADGLSYGAGLKYFSDFASLSLSILKEQENIFYALSLTFYGD